MSELTYLETVDRWQELSAAIKTLQAEEKALREGLFNGTFPDPKEGVNTVELPDGRKLKGTHKLYRNVDEDRVSTLPAKLRKEVLKVSHSLVTGKYRSLDEETRKAVDSILTIKPGLPSLEVVEAKPAEVEVSP